MRSSRLAGFHGDYAVATSGDGGGGRWSDRDGQVKVKGDALDGKDGRGDFAAVGPARGTSGQFGLDTELDGYGANMSAGERAPEVLCCFLLLLCVIAVVADFSASVLAVCSGSDRRLSHHNTWIHAQQHAARGGWA